MATWKVSLSRAVYNNFPPAQVFYKINGISNIKWRDTKQIEVRELLDLTVFVDKGIHLILPSVIHNNACQCKNTALNMMKDL